MGVEFDTNPVPVDIINNKKKKPSLRIEYEYEVIHAWSPLVGVQ